ncbi:MAG: holo-[acyl-carrier-protein] synthase [Leptolyngbya sp. PLA2]|nr:MAG: holo-[acyl-carrier-protein] synthase [Armatimonadota bacterium]MCE7972468.1 holo-[acyl-carrier-protein] synthase [Leptolyngbya sp. PL-A2]MCQ3941432.1 holo-[acyl-carrier-protein] synthase [cyanobacterium CYA1]MDL1904544.1 holo-[acyl-carrier-protein] synthase [Synechococcales cyanobacterium CNB]
MEILGHGIDVVDVARIARLLRRDDDFLYGWFTSREIDALGTRAADSQVVAGRVAAKEAAAKALGTGFAGDVSWQDVEVVPSDNGAPTIILSKGALAVARKAGVTALFASISHERTYAIASVIAAGTRPTPSQGT